MFPALLRSDYWFWRAPLHSHYGRIPQLPGGIRPQAFDTSQNIIISDDNHGQAQVFFDQSYANIRKTIGAYEGIPVITGFVAVSHTGQPTTLGRNGSDFTASIIGAGLGADKVEIWTDVDGVLSGDPRIIDNTFVIDELSVEEAHGAFLLWRRSHSSLDHAPGGGKRYSPLDQKHP
jgi:hypothetical protein